MKHLIITSEFEKKTIFRTEDINGIITDAYGDNKIFFKDKTNVTFDKSYLIEFDNISKDDCLYKTIPIKNKGK